MLKLIQVGEAAGDCTCNYRVEFPPKLQAKDFILAAMKEYPNEWGTIYFIESESNAEIAAIEFRKGKIAPTTLPEELLKRCIKEIRAYGGWSNLNYEVRLEVQDED